MTNTHFMSRWDRKLSWPAHALDHYTPCIVDGWYAALCSELSDESATDAEQYVHDVDWQQQRPPVGSPHQPPQRALNPPTSPSSSPTADTSDVDRTTTSRQPVVVPADAPSHTHLDSALIADWVLTARFLYGPLLCPRPLGGGIKR